jgi:chromosome segregation ATPase
MVNQVHQVREGEAVQRQRIEQLHAAVRRLSDEQPDLITSLVPVHDRLEGLHEVSAQLAALDASLRALPAVIDDAHARHAAAQLDALPNAVALATAPLGIARSQDVASLSARVELLAAAGPPAGANGAAAPVDPSALLEPVLEQLRALSRRVDELATGGSELSAALERTRLDLTGSLADTTGSHAARVHELGTAVTDQLARMGEQLSTVNATVQSVAEQSHAETLRALDERLADVAATHGELTARVDEVRDAVQAVAAAQPDVAGAVAPLAAQLDAAMSELGATVTGGHTRLDEIAAAIEDVRAQPDPDAPVTIEPLSAQLDELHCLTRATGEQLQAMASSIAELRVSRPDITTSLQGLADLLESVRTASDAHRQRLDDMSDSRDRMRAQLAGIAGLAEELRGELQRARQETVTVQDAMTASTDRVLARVDVGANRVLDTVASREQHVGDGIRRLDAALADLRTDVDALGRELRSHRGTDEVSSGAGAALVASAAAAMARLEGRLDQEFDSIGAQIDALGALVHEAIDGMHGATPTLATGTEAVTEKVRAAASSMFEALRATSRQRAARRYRAGRPPPGIGQGD